jgi:sulfur-oxidizing protein SoxX
VVNRLVFITCLGALTACSPEPDSSAEFRLPEGAVDRGEVAFLALGCHACHNVDGTEFESLGVGGALVTLGGEVARVQTYGELVTSIVNPSHKLAPGYPLEEISAAGQSLMSLAYLNEVMTVQQLIDVVAYLQTTYDIQPPEQDPYEYLYYP